MDLTRVLEQSLVVLALILCLGLLVIFGHWLLAAYRAARWRGKRKIGVGALRTIVAKSQVAPGDLAPLRRLPMILRIRSLLELAPSLTGDALYQLQKASAMLGVTAYARRLIRSPFWWRRLLGTQILASLDQADECLPDLLLDPNLAVRERAIEWAARHPRRDVIERLLTLIEEPGTPTLFFAQDSLARMGDRVVDHLASYLEGASGERATPVLQLALAMSEPELAAPAIRLASDPNPDTRVAAVQLLGAIGGENGLRQIRNALDDESARVRAEGVAALGRLKHWPAAGRLAAMMNDPEWIVRRAAALALRDVGNPGLILLRHVAQDSPTEAAQLARHILDVTDDSPSGRQDP